MTLFPWVLPFRESLINRRESNIRNEKITANVYLKVTTNRYYYNPTDS